ncbi:MAG: hypothetical protein Kow0090_13670 [Myxococcota bacterium]
MPPYYLTDIEYTVVVFAVGIGLAVAIMLARGSRYFGFSFKKQSERELEESVHEFGGEVKEANRPMPLFIWLVFIGYFIWAIGYVIFVSFFGL